MIRGVRVEGVGRRRPTERCAPEPAGAPAPHLLGPAIRNGLSRTGRSSRDDVGVPPRRSLLRFLALTLAQLLIFAADVAIDAPVVFTGATVVPVLMAALIAGPRLTFALGVVAFTLTLVAGLVDDRFLTVQHLIRLGTVISISGLSTVTAAGRLRLEEDVGRLALLAAVGDGRGGGGSPAAVAGALLDALIPSYADLARVTLHDLAGPGTRVVVERGRPPAAPSAPQVLPLAVAGRELGTLHLERRARFGRADERFGRALAARTALVIENARLLGELTQAEADQRHVAQALQHSLRPPPPPEIEGARVSAYYRAVGEATQVGGDFYDAYPLGEGWLLVIGDVTGKGAAAASVTALARGAIEAAATQTGSPLQAVARLDALLGRRDELSLCSVALVHLHLRGDRRSAEVLLAGHPPVLLLREGEVRAIGHVGSLPGAFPSPAWRTEVLDLLDGDVLVLRTDGVTDAVGTDGRLGEERLREALRGMGRPTAEAVVTRVRETIDGHTVGAQRDDTAVLAVAIGDPGPVTPAAPAAGSPDDFTVELDGTPASVASARRAVDDHLGARLTDTELQDVRLLVSELASNAVRHGGPGQSSLTLGCDARTVRAAVVDPGPGFVPAVRDAGLPGEPVDVLSEGGHGLRLVARLATRWGVDDAGGTRVWFELDR